MLAVRERFVTFDQAFVYLNIWLIKIKENILKILLLLIFRAIRVEWSGQTIGMDDTIQPRIQANI